MAAIPVLIIAGFLGAGTIVVGNRGARLAGYLLLGLALKSKGYRAGEGPLSQKMPWKVPEAMGKIDPRMKKFSGKTFSFTVSEFESFVKLTSLIGDKPETLVPVIDFLEHFPSSRIS